MGVQPKGFKQGPKETFAPQRAFVALVTIAMVQESNNRRVLSRVNGQRNTADTHTTEYYAAWKRKEVLPELRYG